MEAAYNLYIDYLAFLALSARNDTAQPLTCAPSEIFLHDTARQCMNDTKPIVASTHQQDTHKQQVACEHFASEVNPPATPLAESLVTNARYPKRNMHACSHPGCSLTFSSKYNLRKHLETHEGNRSRLHKCTQCSRTYLHKGNLLRHMPIHLSKEARPTVPCPIRGCERRFTRHDAVYRHMKIPHRQMRNLQ